jgi:Predicted membrane protein (DUF2339)
LNKKFDLSKQWPILFGGFFFTLMMVYIIKVLIDKNLISDPLKLVGGVFISGCVFAIGHFASKKLTITWMGEVISAVGFVGLIFTWFFASTQLNYWDLWISGLLIAISSFGLMWYTKRSDKRILANVAQMGVWSAPFTLELRTEWGYWLVFIYTLSMNVFLWYVSLQKKWAEIHWFAKCSSILLFMSYAIAFHNPSVLQIITFAIVLYAYQLISSIFVNQNQDDQPSLPFIFWDAVFAFITLACIGFRVSVENSVAIMFLIYALANVLLGILTYRLKLPKLNPANHIILGFLFSVCSLLTISSNWDLKTHFVMMIMNLMIMTMLAWGKWAKIENAASIAFVGWLITLDYGWEFTWDTPIGEWGMYLPIFNWGGMAWLITCATAVMFNHYSKSEGLNVATSIIGFVVFGYFLYLQTENGFIEYQWDRHHFGIVMSVIYGVYAMGLFIWSVNIRKTHIEILSAMLLIVVALKSLFVDLWDSDSAYKIILFAILGVISFGMMMYRQKRQPLQVEQNDEIVS